MAKIAANLRLITATVSVGADDYSAHIADYNFTPSSAASEVTDVTGKVNRFAGESGWTLNLNVFQDFTATGLARKMLTDEGTKVTIKIADGPTTWTSEVTLVAPQIGGATKQVGVSALALPASKPVPSVTPA